MNFKYWPLLLALTFAVQTVYGLDKWNILYGGLRDLSQNRDKNIGLTIQKSISLQLQKQQGFNLLQSRTNLNISNFQMALAAGRAFKADVLLYGDYYIEGEDLVIIVDVFDVLENRPKMRKYYSGDVGIEIFDTVDAISADLVQKIREALPEMTAESEVRIRQVRKNIYETEKVNIKRMFYTRLGFYTEMGPKQYYRIKGDTQIFQFSFPDSLAPAGFGSWYKYSTIPIGAALRLWDFRIDLMLSGLPGVPQFAWQNPDYVYTTLPASFFLFQFSYYLPWFNNSLAVSIGTFDMERASVYKFDTENKRFSFNKMGGSDIPINLSFGLVWNPSEILEFSFSLIPFLSKTSKTDPYDKSIPNNTNYFIFNRDFPALTLGAVYFLGNFGFELKTFVDSYHYMSFTLKPDGTTNLSYNEGAVYGNTTLVSLYAGVIYRVDFLK